MFCTPVGLHCLEIMGMVLTDEDWTDDQAKGLLDALQLAGQCR